ncbi:MAG: pyridoxine 5'-phosphate synthase [Alphaproteobacteria bacterium]|nr:pyridoxine 5'-phosphate synthase [Alphaproteobacteria bacterium]
MARLSVNLNKIALLRNSRRTGVPDVCEFAGLAYEAGAQGITVHPRPDERHIRGSDVPALAALMQDWRPACELNIEGYPDERLFAICGEVRPEQATLVPDGPGVLTSEEGWKLDNRDMPLVVDAVARLKRLGARVILFIDPDPSVIKRVPGSGADGVEIYTGSYADAFRHGNAAKMLDACAATSARAGERGLVVNAGHDLNLDNLPALVAAMPNLTEASIGHELTADALKMGWQAAVRAYRAALAPTS